MQPSAVSPTEFRSTGMFSLLWRPPTTPTPPYPTPILPPAHSKDKSSTTLLSTRSSCQGKTQRAGQESPHWFCQPSQPESSNHKPTSALGLVQQRVSTTRRSKETSLSEPVKQKSPVECSRQLCLGCSGYEDKP